MRSYLRAAIATITGIVVSIVLAYLGAILMLVARIGIPLGSDGRELLGGEYAALLVMAGGAAAAGGHIAAGLARQHARSVVTAQAVLLAGGALWGFTSPESQWPVWWAAVLAAVAAAGTGLGGLTRLAGITRGSSPR
ncbi:MAG TPA: hypothetical protein VJ813_10945 [Vicinamibacterales bacterium]|nr:hypothetical protein [Vicinamibacterales bacterium]